MPATELAARLRRDHPRGTVLVVGHSNTVPGLVSALCGCAVAPLGEHDHDRMYEVRIGPDGRGVLVERRY
jgi:broad specificity phosphatase PhoE